jgi:SAM-dependent methyltransferase
MGYTIFDRAIAWLRYRAAFPHIRSQSQVCDIGCGIDATFLTWLGPHIRIGIGLDRQVGCVNSPGISVVCADISKGLPLRGGDFDHVVMLAVLEHLDAPTAILAETFRILKPGGSLILTWPSAAVDPILNILHRLAIVSDEMESQEHHPRIPLETLTELLQEIGFERFLHRQFECRLNNLLVAFKRLDV